MARLVGSLREGLCSCYPELNLSQKEAKSFAEASLEEAMVASRHAATYKGETKLGDSEHGAVISWS